MGEFTNSLDKTGQPDVCHEYSMEYYLNNIYCQVDE